MENNLFISNPEWTAASAEPVEILLEGSCLDSSSQIVRLEFTLSKHLQHSSLLCSYVHLRTQLHLANPHRARTITTHP